MKAIKGFANFTPFLNEGLIFIESQVREEKGKIGRRAKEETGKDRKRRFERSARIMTGTENS